MSSVYGLDLFGFCDPKKAADCKKQNCYWENKGPCVLTTNPAHFAAADDELSDGILGTMYRTACVNCKDCACCMKVDEHEYWCKAWGPMQLVRPDDFCSKGRRRNDE